MSSRRYIEITSTYRNRKQWPCPSEFIVPIDCRNRSENPLDAQDPIALGYPEKGWYSVPQTTQEASNNLLDQNFQLSSSPLNDGPPWIPTSGNFWMGKTVGNPVFASNISYLELDCATITETAIPSFIAQSLFVQPGRYTFTCDFSRSVVGIGHLCEMSIRTTTAVALFSSPFSFEIGGSTPITSTSPIATPPFVWGTATYPYLIEVTSPTELLICVSSKKVGDPAYIRNISFTRLDYIPRNINGSYYGSLWPLSPDLSSISAMHFSGGNYNSPQLNSVVTQPENIWSALTGSVSHNPYYTPETNYFSGALLLRFAPVSPTNPVISFGQDAVWYPGLAGRGSPDPSVLLNIPNVQKITVSSGFAISISVGDRLSQGVIPNQSQGVVVCVEDSTTFYVGILPRWTGNATSPEIFVVTTLVELNGIVGTVFPTIVSSVENGARYCGDVETSIISSYNSMSGAVTLLQPLSEDFNFQDDYYLIDFFSDPENSLSSYFNNGSRIFIPNGSTSPQAYEGMIVENYTLSSYSSKVKYSTIKKYDFIRKVAFLETALPLTIFESPERTIFPLSTIRSQGSDSFLLRHKPELAVKTYERISVTEGSILNINVHSQGSKYKIGETISSPSDTTVYYSSPTTVFAYSSANYVFVSSIGRGFRGEITSVSSTGGIISIKVIQQGQGYHHNSYMSLVSNSGNPSGTDCLLTFPTVYQAIEVYRKNTSDDINKFSDGGFIFLSAFGQINTDGLTNTNKMNGSPSLPRYFYLPPDSTTSLQNTNLLDIRQSGYPLRLNGCVSTNNFNIPENGIRQIVSTKNKDITFGDWMATVWTGGIFGNSSEVVFPTSVIYLNTSYNFSNSGLTDSGTSIVVRNASPLTSSMYLQQQNIEFLEYSTDNHHSLNFTGTRVRQNQMVCYEIKLISVIMPNIPLDNEIGGLIAFYPYFYIQLSNVNAPMKGNLGTIYSNNPNANRALFRVDIRDTNTPLRSKFIKLRGGGTQTVKFRPNDDLYFKVFLNNGELFETSTKDTSPPLPPDFFVQISAQFQIQILL